MQRSRGVALVTLGTEGDVAPFVHIGAALARRGFSVTLISNENWCEFARSHGLNFLACAKADPCQNGRDDLGFFVDHRIPAYRRIHELISTRALAGEALFVAYKASILGAEKAVRAWGLPSCRIVLQPGILGRESHDAGRIRYGEGKVAAAFQQAAAKFLNEVSPSPGRQLPSARTLMMFPEWFWGERAVGHDWATATGFPLTEPQPLPEWARRHFSGAAPMIALTSGTGTQNTSAIKAHASKLAALGQSVVLLDRHSPEVKILAQGRLVIAPDLDLGAILPFASALVHHGGIGTAARGLACGVSQVVMPDRFDQPDNARRLQALKVAEVLDPDQPTSDLLHVIKRVRECAGMRGAASHWADRLRGQDGLAQAAAQIENDLGRWERGEAVSQSRLVASG